MQGDTDRQPAPGSTAIIIPVPIVAKTLEPLIHQPAGIPAHLTILYPFLPALELDDSTIQALARICARTPAMRIRFRRTGRFPDVLYLAPEPAGPLRALTERIARAWPQAPPYEGRFEQVIPHLTVRQGTENGTLEKTEQEIAARLPVNARLEHAELWISDDNGTFDMCAHLPFKT